MEFLPLEIHGKRVYCGFWKRFCAGWIDFFVLIPFAIIFLLLEGIDKQLAILITIPSTILFSMYNIYFHAHFGGTIGKLAVGIRVTKPDGRKIGWSEAWKRSSIDIGFALLMLCVKVWTLMQVDSEQYSTTTFIERIKLLKSYEPSWFYLVTVVHNIWIWSEVIVLLFNDRKRALHDFIAGTVVIKQEFAEQSGRYIRKTWDGFFTN